ncbi:MAG: metallophosphatase family protein [Treponema sp.]|jgi:predicted phosphodiesterase|nr:metallophosphatase family protein [Treponema sp.]
MRALILSDIHANLDALNSVLENAKNKYDILISLGDIVGYGPNPNECVEIIAEKASASLAGNHDLGVCDKIKTDDFSPRAQYSQNWTQGTLNDSSLKYLNTLRPSMLYEKIFLSHGSPGNSIWGYIFSEMDAIIAFASVNFSLSFFGHTHVPSYFATSSAEGIKRPIKIKNGKANRFIKTKDVAKRILMNPGSVGFPRTNLTLDDKNNSFSYAEYALFDLESGKWQFKQVRYDITHTRQLMLENGLR